MKLPVIIACFVSSLGFSQSHPEMEYVRYVDSLVNNDLTKTRNYPEVSACGGNVTGHYTGKDLIFIESLHLGEQANSCERNFYVRNDSIVYTFEEQCYVSDRIDYPAFIIAHTDSLGNTELSELPMNCMTVHVYHLSGELVKAVDGEDVFGESRTFLEFREANLNCYEMLKKELAGNF